VWLLHHDGVRGASFILFTAIAGSSLLTQRSVAAPPEATKAFEEGLAHFDTGNLEAAKKSYARALSIDPTYGRAEINLGIVEVLLGRVSAGLTHCEKALAAEPGAAKGHYCVGLARLRQRKNEDAAAAFAKSISLFQEDPMPKMELAHLHRQAKRYKEAVELYREAVRKRPDDPNLHVHLGYCYKQLGDWTAAEVEYRKTVQKDPTSYFGHLNLGVVLVRNGKDEEAEPHYKTAAELDPKAAEPHFNLGNLHRRNGRLEEALVHYQKAAELGPKAADHHLELARTYWRLGKRGEARVSLDLARKVASEQERATIEKLAAQVEEYPIAPTPVTRTRPKVQKQTEAPKPVSRTPAP
jgi:tetratricopeptide (TPR) repeat protein